MLICVGIRLFASYVCVMFLLYLEIGHLEEEIANLQSV